MNIHISIKEDNWEKDEAMTLELFKEKNPIWEITVDVNRTSFNNIIDCPIDGFELIMQQAYPDRSLCIFRLQFCSLPFKKGFLVVRNLMGNRSLPTHFSYDPDMLKFNIDDFCKLIHITLKDKLKKLIGENTLLYTNNEIDKRLFILLNGSSGNVEFINVYSSINLYYK